MSLPHPTLDGTPILIGDLIRATDLHSSDLDDEAPFFTRTGYVTSISLDDQIDQYVIVIRPEGDTSEEFYIPDSEFERVRNG